MVLQDAPHLFLSLRVWLESLFAFSSFPLSCSGRVPAVSVCLPAACLVSVRSVVSAGAITHLKFVRFTSNFVHFLPHPTKAVAIYTRSGLTFCFRLNSPKTKVTLKILPADLWEAGKCRLQPTLGER